MSQGGNGEGDQKNKKEDGSRDWDSSWSEFRERRSGGVFQLPDVESDNKNNDIGDKRVERLTSFWGNETGFLLAIGGIVIIAAFYSYVYATGGISHQ